MLRANQSRFSNRALYIAALALLILCPAFAACGGTRTTANERTPTPEATSLASGMTATPTISGLASNAGQPGLAPPPTPETAQLPDLTHADVASEIAALVGETQGFAEVFVALPDGTPIYATNAYEPMEAASLYKLAVMVEVYRQRDTGLLSFDDGIELQPYYFLEGDDAISNDEIGTVVDIGTLLHAMITVSSNVAAAALLEHVGSDNINATMQSLGLTGTEVRWMLDPGVLEPAPDDSGSDSTEPAPDDSDGTEEQTPSEDPAPSQESEDTGARDAARALAAVHSGSAVFDARADAAQNVTTAADLALLFHLLLAGQVVSPDASAEMLSLLSEQEINDRLPAYLPSGAVVAHKTGNLDGLVHDAGVVYAPSGPRIVVVLTEDVDEGVADELIARIALLTWEDRE